ncbi:Hypothetical protein PHPALM_37190 [Phytophthora palmivora]|uniref:Uncharacterized protein n=1 Tax=Phytophthora palmivora TaxID=4796 RepID=A0A2P4WY36_9STRA|nr:Hypothetical protein PHPALM_37190 [Phytophthora palmivora]
MGFGGTFVQLGSSTTKLRSEMFMVARANNPLEHFHRELNNSLNPYPNIITFVLIIRQSYVTKLANVAVGRRGRGTKTNAKISNEGLSDDDSEDDRLLGWTFVNPQIKTPL